LCLIDIRYVLFILTVVIVSVIEENNHDDDDTDGGDDVAGFTANKQSKSKNYEQKIIYLLDLQSSCSSLYSLCISAPSSFVKSPACFRSSVIVKAFASDRRITSLFSFNACSNLK
jgi:hypothetical protein